jgi:hypothetical protein
MSSDFDLKRLSGDIRLMKQAAERLAAVGEAFPALEKNARRILASLKMLEINISDLLELDD